MKMLRHSALIMSLSATAIIQAAPGSAEIGRWRPTMHAPHASSAVLWNPIDGGNAVLEREFAESESYRNWAESIDDGRYLEFLSCNGVLPASPPGEPDPTLGFGLPEAVLLDVGAGDDILKVVEAGRAGMSETEDPVRRWCAIGELPPRSDVENGLIRNRFFLGQRRGIAGEIDFDRLHEMVFEVPAVMVDRYDATGDGMLDDVVAVDVGGVIVTVVERQGSSAVGGSFRRGDGREDDCVLRRSAVIAEWIERRRKEGY
ncbi:hypothetical protein OAG01_00745 [bacterium]|nr:hypothetical protein [bacterium]